LTRQQKRTTIFALNADVQHLHLRKNRIAQMMAQNFYTLVPIVKQRLSPLMLAFALIAVNPSVQQ
jgi:hypothetical protein